MPTRSISTGFADASPARSNRWLAAIVLLAAAACGPAEDGSNEAAGQRAAGVTCEPQMSLFPVADAHNIGWDGTCKDGTCDISCPDQHANSDWGGSHHGIDVFAYRGAPIVAVADGTVVKVGVVSDTSGIRVRLRDACGWEYYYGHLDAAYVTKGQQVHAGELLGAMGNTGTGGVHLHFNVSPDGDYSHDIDPFDLLASTSHTSCDAPPDPGPAPAPKEPPSGCGLLGNGGTLEAGQSIASCDGRFVLVMQYDGNLVLYQGDVPLWSSETWGTDGNVARLLDGNVTVEGPQSGILWTTFTSAPDAFLAVQDDGNLVVYRPDLTPIWSSKTCCH